MEQKIRALGPVMVISNTGTKKVDAALFAKTLLTEKVDTSTGKGKNQAMETVMTITKLVEKGGFSLVKNGALEKVMVIIWLAIIV